MATLRAGRTAAATSRAPQTAIPHAAPSARTAVPTARRRAALSHTSHAMTDASGFDGEVCVRYEAAYRRAEPAGGERRLVPPALEGGIRTFLHDAQAADGPAVDLRPAARHL